MTIIERRWPDGAQTGTAYRAFVAAPIAGDDTVLAAATLAECDRAARALGDIGSRTPVAWDPVGRLLLRAEGLASSDIEGIRVTPRRLLAASIAPVDDESARWVLDNIAAVETAYDDAYRELTSEILLGWHRILMGSSPLPERYVGRFRDVQGWIGGMDPTSAVFVPAPAEFVAGLVDDLVGFAGRRDLSPVAQAAILHAQFETIHPFADGNGRVGRALVGWCLRRRDVVSRAIPPLSPVIASDTDRYVYGLWAYRNGRLDEWVSWFADVCVAAAGSVAELTGRIATLLEIWRVSLADSRADDSARRLVEHLPDLPVLDVGRAMAAIGVSERSARGALTTLEGRGVLQPLPAAPDGPGRPRRRWIAGDLVDLL
jgi:Fic family protein